MSQRRILDLLLFGAVFILTDCSKTTVRLTGTPGAYYSGYVLHDCDREPIQKDHRKLPDADVDFGLYLGTSVRLRECEFRKENTNTTLAAEIRTRGLKDTITAPPGTTGVRVKRQGNTFSSEVF